MARQWNFFTNHAHVLICLATGRGSTLREIAEQVGITERATSRIVNAMAREGVVKRTRRGRCNHYEIQHGFPLRHPLEEHCSVGQLLRVVVDKGRSGPEVGEAVEGIQTRET